MDELSAFVGRLVDTALRYSLPLRLAAVAGILAVLLALRTTWKRDASLMQIPRYTIRALPFTVIGTLLVAVLAVVIFPGSVPDRASGTEPLPLTTPCGDRGFIGDPATKTYYSVNDYRPFQGQEYRCFPLPYDATHAGYAPSEGR